MITTPAEVTVTVAPEAQTLVSRYGVQRELQQTLDYAKQNIHGLHMLRVEFSHRLKVFRTNTYSSKPELNPARTAEMQNSNGENG